MIKLGYKIVDLHVHLRDEVAKHTSLAREAGIDTIVCMPNTIDCLDSLEKVRSYVNHRSFVRVVPVSSITVGRKGKRLVDINKITPIVAGFSDDGDCLNDLQLLENVLKENVLVMAHLEPEAIMARKYLTILKKVGGRIHFQHISSGATVKLMRKAKAAGLRFTCETCPHYFTFTNNIEDIKVNPPIGTPADVREIKKGLADGTIDCIASDYAPTPRPRGTGIASFNSFIPLCYGLVLDGTLTKRQLEEKISINPKKILWQSGFKI